MKPLKWILGIYHVYFRGIISEEGVVLFAFILSFDLPFNEKDIAKQAPKHSK
ncbi:hypothetical protein HMPREF0848_01198 [Streptococcus sp. C150]|jgi:hypothetical protein|nr:hypothetical protein HMPREF0848_01198 [Streptococcus sp. C150]